MREGLSSFKRSRPLRIPACCALVRISILTLATSVLALSASGVLAQSRPTAMTEADAVARALADPAFADQSSAQREAARAGADAITRFANPHVSVSRGALSGPGEDETEWEIEVVQPLDLTGRRSALRAAAVAEADAVDAETERRTAERAADARRAWTACAVAGRRAEAARVLVAHLGEAERIVTERTEAGDTAVYDLRRVRVESRAAQGEASLAEGELRAECAVLARLTGTTEARAAGPLAPPAPMAATVETTRADLVARERRVAAAAQTARAAERSRWPEIEVGLGWRRVEALGVEADGPQIMIGASIPLFDTGSARAREARARERAAAADLALARREAATDVEAASARLNAALDAAAAARAARDDASRLGTIARTAYEAGEIGVAELVDAYRAAHETELSIIELTGRANLAAIELDLAQGGPNP